MRSLAYSARFFGQGAMAGKTNLRLGANEIWGKLDRLYKVFSLYLETQIIFHCFTVIIIIVMEKATYIEYHLRQVIWC